MMFIDIKKFGAKGDGATDDTDAIQNAIGELKSRGGGRLYFPQGIYLYTKTIYLTSDLTIDGEGERSILRVGDISNPAVDKAPGSLTGADAGKNPTLFVTLFALSPHRYNRAKNRYSWAATPVPDRSYIGPHKNITIQNIMIEGTTLKNRKFVDKDDGGVNTITIEATDTFTLRNVIIDSATEDCIRVSGSGYRDNDGSSKNIRIENCIMRNAFRGIELEENTSDILITENSIYDVIHSCVRHSDCTGARVEWNHFKAKDSTLWYSKQGINEASNNTLEVEEVLKGDEPGNVLIHGPVSEIPPGGDHKHKPMKITLTGNTFVNGAIYVQYRRAWVESLTIKGNSFLNSERRRWEGSANDFRCLYINLCNESYIAAGCVKQLNIEQNFPVTDQQGRTHDWHYHYVSIYENCAAQGVENDCIDIDETLKCMERSRECKKTVRNQNGDTETVPCW